MASATSSIYNFCEQWLQAWTGNHPGKLLAFYHKDAHYIDPANKNGLSGHSELENYFKKLLSLNPNWKWEIEELFITTKGCTLKWKASIPVKDQILIEYGLDIVEIKEEKIIRNEVYFDRTNWFNLLKK